jgi:hypothetical protein
MSLKAKRFKEEAWRRGDLHLVPDNKVTKHHVPPKNPDQQPHFLRRVDYRHHKAYHLLFGAVASYEDACKILLKDWWTKPAER